MNKSSSSMNSGKMTQQKKRDERDRRNSEGRKYAQIPKESIALYAETIMDKIGDDVTRPLAEDVSYRLREIIHACSIYLAQANRSHLTTEDVNQVLQNKDVPPVFGHSGGGMINFTYLDEINLFVEEDPEVDLIQLALSNTSITQKGHHFIKSMWLLHSPNTDITEPPNTHSQFDAEERLSVPTTLINYYKQAYRVLFGSSQQLFQVLTRDFSTNVKLGPIAPHVVEALSQALDESDKSGERRFWLLDAIFALANNEAVDLSPSLSVNKLVTSLVHCALNFYSCQGGFTRFSIDEDFREKSSFILSKVLRRWCGSVVVREVLRKLSAFLQDFNTPLPVHRGALHLLTAMGQAPLALCLWPLLVPPGNYGTFLTVMQTAEDFLIDYEAIKNTILTASVTLQHKEINNNEDESATLSCPKRQTPGDIEQEKLARDVQQVLYEVFGDTVCCRWPLPASSYHPQVIVPRHVPYGYPQYRRCMISTIRKDPADMDQVFEDRTGSLPSLLLLSSDSCFSMLNLGGSNLLQKQCKPRKRCLEHVIFAGHSPFQSMCNAFLWTGQIQRSVQDKLRVYSSLRTIL